VLLSSAGAKSVGGRQSLDVGVMVQTDRPIARAGLVRLLTQFLFGSTGRPRSQ
jgi:hypothetical protein